MFLHSFVFRMTRYLVVAAVLATTYLYLYPIWFGCVFPSPDGHVTTAFRNTLIHHLERDTTTLHLAPFRLLVLADPQLEGDSSLPNSEDALSHRLVDHYKRIQQAEVSGFRGLLVEVIQELVLVDIPRAFQATRKRLDLFGNDYYLAHIYRTLHWWTKPTHVTVLGDLIGSQWVDDDEFRWRGWRYWNRVFAKGEKVQDEFTTLYEQDEQMLLDMTDPAWSQRIINIAGNHDIGYAGDISKDRISRYEEAFGKTNWDVRFSYPNAHNSTAVHAEPTLHLVVLNSMLFDTPAMDQDLQDEVYKYLNSIISKRLRPVEDRSSFTLLLTHVPLHKEEGLCVDGPFFDYWDDSEDCDGSCKPTGLKEQNHLSEHSSQTGLLESLFGMSGNPHAPLSGKGRPGLILNGHDHAGCDTWHFVPANATMKTRTDADAEQRTAWEASKWRDADLSNPHTGIREVTLRSMMGDYGGNAGLLSAWFDFENEEWKYEIQMCKLGVQHIWWAIHVLDILAIMSVGVSIVLKFSTFGASQEPTQQATHKKSTKTD